VGGEERGGGGVQRAVPTMAGGRAGRAAARQARVRPAANPVALHMSGVSSQSSLVRHARAAHRAVLLCGQL